MKKIALMLVVCLSFSLLLFGCNNSTSSKASQKDNSSTAKPNESATAKNEGTNMVFVTLPSPPKCKKISDKETIKKVMDFIDSAEKTPFETERFGGWVMLINLTTSDGLQQYSVCGDILTIGDKYYKVSEDFVKNLAKLYNEIDVQEVDY